MIGLFTTAFVNLGVTMNVIIKLTAKRLLLRANGSKLPQPFSGSAVVMKNGHCTGSRRSVQSIKMRGSLLASVRLATLRWRSESVASLRAECSKP